jgi:hypothetical protein
VLVTTSFPNDAMMVITMTTFRNCPRHAKGTLLLMDVGTGHYTGIIRLQINPSQPTRGLKVRGAGAEG